ncbi:MAG TPA: cation transporter [Pyrinomonadaceae bacterium]|jgi:divalent metal cation (Fe/Co/Zn/Cd) transporter
MVQAEATRVIIETIMSAGVLNGERRRAKEVRRGRRLEYLTVAWNSLEGLIAIGAGIVAGSVALVGFGFDSVIEVTSGAALIWRLHMDAPARRERAEQVALKLVGVSFLLLAAYVASDAALSLVRRESPEASYAGIALAVLSLVVMPLLARAKRRVAASIESRALEADSRQTDICAYLSAILLGGLLLNALLGWWWADPVAALAMTPIIAREGVQALRGKACCNGEACH